LITQKEEKMRRLKRGSTNIRRRLFAVVIVVVLAVSSICLGYSGGLGTLEEPYRIANKADLLELAGSTEDYNKCFILTADINMGGQVFTTAIIAADTSSDDYFQGTAFMGTFDGNSHKITNFTINGGSNYYLGLFGYIDAGGTVKNLGLENCEVSGWDYVGGLVGLNYYDGTVSNCYSTGAVSGVSWVGGLMGINHFGTVSICYAAGNVFGSGSVGGLVGYNNYGTVSKCYAAGTVSGVAYVGGLVGYRYYGTVSNCYARGSVSGGYWYVGGLVGWNNSTVSNCYSTGSVSGSSIGGGLVGYDYFGTVTASFWDIDTSGQATSAGGTGKTTAEMQTKSTFTDAGWDFVGEVINGPNDIWKICEGTNYPKLSWQIPLLGDFVCPDGVEMNDLAELCEEWLLKELSSDVWPEGGDGIVNFFDWAELANEWQVSIDFEALADFAKQWLKTGARYCIADIAPAEGGDGIVNMPDFAVLANNWLARN
jgi:hypothetical protein